jgi:GT2 family glycosyltransferase
MPEPKSQTARSDAPQLSIILVIGSQRERERRALQSLLEQSAIDRMEILLYDLGPTDCPLLPGSDHPRVRLTRQTPQDLLGMARADAIRTAKAPVVCFMEEHCELQPGSAEALIRAHQGPWAGVGCDIINGNPDSARSNQAFRMNYGIYLPPKHVPGPTRFIPGQNSAFKRDVLLHYGEQLDLMLNADLVLQWKLMRDGYQLFYEPAAKMAHRNENTFRSLCTGVFYWNWCFSHVRAKVFHWSLARRALRILLAPLIPWWRVAKMFTWVPQLGLAQFLEFLTDIPFIVGVSYCAAAGQVAGLLNKLAQGARVFSHFEMNEPRLQREEWAR